MVIVATASSLKTHTINSCIDLRGAKDSVDLVSHRKVKRHINSLAAKSSGLGQTFLIEVANNDTGGT